MLWSSTDVHQCFRAIYCLSLQCQNVCQARNQHETGDKKSDIYLSPVSCWFLDLFTLQPWRQAVHFYETSVSYYRTTWWYIPEDSTPHSHHCENLNSKQTAYSVHTLFRWINKESSQICQRQFLSKIRMLVKLVPLMGQLHYFNYDINYSNTERMLP